MTVPVTPPPSVSAIREWESLMRQIGSLAEQALDLAQGRAERLYQVNQIAAQIEATPRSEIVGDSGYTRESARAARAFIEWFVAGANQPITIDTVDGEEITMTPLQIMSIRQ